MTKKLTFSLLALFVILFLFNGFVDFAHYQLDKVYITVSTFLFSIFNGFFISRQSSRYTEIRNNLSRFDADMTIIYRESSHLSPEEHAHFGEIIAGYYHSIIKSKDWAYYFSHKSNLISSLHAFVGTCGDINMEKMRGECLRKTMGALDDIQIIRKILVSLKEETIPRFQQFFIYILAAILLLAIMTLPSQGVVLASVLKSIYMITVISVVILLRKFDNLTLFEGTIGEHSAKDVLGIIEGDR